MKNIILAASAIALLGAGSALADGMDNAVGNTVRITVNDAGQGIDFYFDADGMVSNSLGQTGASWSFTDGQLCVTPPEGQGESTCGPWDETLAPGGSWETDGWSQDGSTLSISILEGRGHEAPTPPAPPGE